MAADAESTAWSRYVLYVAHSHEEPDRLCTGSRKAMKLMEPVKEDVLVQSIDVLQEKGVALPDWLQGTPTLVDTSDKSAYSGTQALDHLKELAGGGKVATLDEMEGVAPNGRIDVGFEHEHSMDSDVDADLGDGGKITEEDVQRYMQRRNQGAPPPPPV